MNLNNQATKEFALTKRVLVEKIKLVDIFVRNSLTAGGKVMAFGVASKLEARGIKSYNAYIKELVQEGIISNIETVNGLQRKRKDIVLLAFRAGIGGSKNARVYTYKKGALLSRQKMWRRELRELQLPSCAEPPLLFAKCPPRWSTKTIERMLELLEKVVAHEISYIYGLEVVRSQYSSNICELLRSHDLLLFKGYAKHISQEILDLSRHGYTAMTGVMPTRIPPNAKVWEVQLNKIKKNFPALEQEIRGRG